MVDDPRITDQHIEFQIFGETLYRGVGCDDLSPKYAYFDPTYPYSQFIITEAAATCMASKIAQSKLSRFRMTRSTLNAFLVKDDLRFDTTSIKREMPILFTKLGKDKPLEFILSFRDMKVGFAKGDKDVTLEMIAKI